MKICIVIPYRGIGDIIFHLPIIRGLAKKYSTKINIITNKINKAKYILKYEKLVNKIEYINFERKNQIKKSFFFLKKINSLKLDICILTAPTKRLIIPLIFSNSKKKIFFKKNREKDLSKYVLNQSKSELKNIKLIKDYRINYFKNKISETNIFVSIDSHHDSNNWDQKYYIELITRLLKKKSINRIYVNFAPSKVSTFKKIKNKFCKKNKITFTYLFNFTKLINTMNNCKYIVGNESGPICIGAALNKKVLSIYYPKHTNKSSLTINKKVKFFNSDVINYKVIISKILNIIK